MIQSFPLRNHVEKLALQDIKRNKYYGLLFDSTPNISHREQMSQVVIILSKIFFWLLLKYMLKKAALQSKIQFYRN